MPPFLLESRMSIFQNYPIVNKQFPISLGIERYIINSIQQAVENEETGAPIYQIVNEAFCQVYTADKVSAQLPELVKLVISHIESLNSQEGVTRKQHYTQSLGTQYAQWLSSLDSSQACLFLADYDIEKAKQWYWLAPTELVSTALKVKSEQLSQQVLANMEASMYGFGGKYSDDGGGQGFDLCSSEGLDALKACGF